MNPQEQFWSGEFGNEYTRRNRVDWRARVPFWSGVMWETGARSVYEVGCNAGWNLSAIRASFDHVALWGCEINEQAANQAWTAGFQQIRNEAFNGTLSEKYEMVFTAGVLIHIAPPELQRLMDGIVRLSSRWVLAVEYESTAEEMVEYRGHAERLWRRPYGKLYKDMGLKLISSAPAEGFDRCTHWLLEKP